MANYGIAVNLPASVPEVTAVGGTMFLEGNQYWNSSGTALTYIPETAWNEVGLGLASSGGGRSIFFTKPDWHTGTGVPNDGRRDVPDVAFSAAASDVPYAIVLNGQYQSVGGTSAGTPSFAGSVAILNQYLVSKGAAARAGLGTINPTLYRLSQTNPNVFHDITTGSNIVPCNIYSQYCSAPTIGYLATRGYDLATGLGSVDINAMVSNWAPQAMGTTTTLSANPTSILNTAATLLTATVRTVSGTATPSGTVTFQVSGRALGSVTLSGSAGVTTALLNVNGSSFSVGSSVITAVYNGATGFGASANTVALTVTVPTAVSLVTATATPKPVYQQSANSGGYTFFYTLKLIESAGVGTTLTSFSVNGTSYNAQIAQFFGTASLAARASLSSSIQSYGFTVPGNVAFVFGGQDPGGRAWTSTLSVPFFPPQVTGSMTLSVSPDIAHQNPSAAPTCQFTQQLEIQERNGLGIELTQLLASGSDQSSQIRSLFGTSRLPPYGHLTAPFCWSGPSLPQAPIYQLTGVDDVGNKIVQSLTPMVSSAETRHGWFSVSANSESLSSSGSLQAASSLNVVSTGTAPKWTATIFPANKTTSWLSISPQSNTASGPLNVTASSSGLANGSYAAALILESENAFPHVINLPVTLTVGAVPSLNIGAVVNVAGEFGRLTNGGFATVYGTKLSNTSRGWGNSDFAGNALPTSLDNVSVLVNGKKSYINYISPGQINFLVHEDTALGDVTVQVVNGSLSSNLYPSQRTSVGPANFAYSQGGGVYPIASFPDGSPVGPTGLISSSTHPAKPGDVLALWMSGLGPTSPAYGGGQIIHSPLNTAVAPILTVGGVRATLDFAGLVGAGLYQVNFHVPQVANGDQPIAFSINGVLAQAGLLLTVHN